MKLFVIVTPLFVLSACAAFPSGTKVAPSFPEDQFELSQNANIPSSEMPTAAAAQRGR